MLESFTRWYLAIAEWVAGRLAEAEAAMASGIAGWRAARHRAPAAAAWGYHCLGLVQRDQGRLEAALATYREALAVAAEPDGTAPQIAGVARPGRLGQAERLQLSPLIVGMINPVPAQRARLALAQGDVDAPPAVRAWRQAATKVRAVGSFDPQRPDAYYMTGGPLAQWFDVIVHRQTVTPWQPL
jgi:tetratricopeptide (TPR) repeat protein